MSLLSIFLGNNTIKAKLIVKDDAYKAGTEGVVEAAAGQKSKEILFFAVLLKKWKRNEKRRRRRTMVFFSRVCMCVFEHTHVPFSCRQAHHHKK